jgi:5-methylcytosine-specific restriction endonuclease McrA
MRYTDIKRHLKPYGIVASRKTTINGAFAAAIAPCDSFEDSRVREAISALNQNPDTELLCVYCGASAETWDHVFAIVKDSKFSGYGHRLGNLLPCCKPCNSKKGNKDWRQFLLSLPSQSSDDQAKRSAVIEAYLKKYIVHDPLPERDTEYLELEKLKTEIIKLMSQADDLAQKIRGKNADSFS